MISNSNKRKYLSNIFDMFNLTQMVDQPTRIGDTSSTLIDLIFVNKNVKVIDITVSDTHGITDHFLVRCELNLNEISQF